MFVAVSTDNTKIWFTEWASNKIGFLDLTKQIPYKMLLTNDTLYAKPLIFKNNTSYKINVSLIRNNFSISNQGNLSLNNIDLSVAGMTDNGPLLLMDAATFCSIISRTKCKMRLLNDGYSRGDTHRKHIHKRLQHLSHLDWKNGDRLKCDKCNETIELNSPLFIHRRRSYNRFFRA